MFSVFARSDPDLDPRSYPGSLSFHCVPAYTPEWLAAILRPSDSSYETKDPAVEVELRLDSAAPSTTHWDWRVSDSAPAATLHHGAVALMRDMLARDRLSATVGGVTNLQFDLREARDDLLEFNRLCTNWRDEAGTPLITDTADEFTDERKLQIQLMSETKAAALFFRCEFEEYCYGRRPRARLAVYAVSELTRIVPRREAKVGEVGDVERVLVQLRVDQAPALRSTWWWIAPDMRSLGLAVSPPFGNRCDEDEQLLREAVDGQRLIAKVQTSNVFQFDLAAARNDLVEFTRRCAAWRTAERAESSQSPSDGAGN